MLADSPGVTLDHRHRRKFAPKHRRQSPLVLESDDALGRTPGADEAPRQAARAGSELKNGARSRPVDTPRNRIGEPRAAGVCRSDSQRLLQPQGEEDTGIRVHVATRCALPTALLYH